MAQIKPDVNLRDYMFSPDFPAIVLKYQELMKKGEVEQFLANKLKDEIDEHQQVNRELLFEVCQMYDIKEVFVGESELVAGDERRDGWPAIWRVKEVLDGYAYLAHGNGFGAGCGNHGQTQTTNNGMWFGRDFVEKAYDVNTGEEVDIEPFRDNMVCTRQRNW